MTLLLLNTRIGQFALAAAAVAMILVAFGAPAVTEAAGSAQTAAAAEGASEDFIFTLLIIIFGAGFAVSAAVGGIIIGATSA